MAETQTHSGSCHCGKVAYEVQMALEGLIECNCSHCYRKGLILGFVPAGDFVLKNGEAALNEYRFNTHKLQHLVCAACGVQSFARGQHPKTGEAMVAVNVRTLHDLEPWSFETMRVDGRSF